MPSWVIHAGASAGDDVWAEQPVHDVTIDGFWMAKTELTLRQWNALLRRPVTLTAGHTLRAMTIQS